MMAKTREITANPAIEINDLRFSWSKSQPNVLDIPRFLLDSGERVFIQGASGSGKSTLLSVLAGIHAPNTGKIKILDFSISDMRSVERDQFRADHIGLIFQMFNLIPYLTVLENVTLPSRFSKLRSQNIVNAGLSLDEEAMRLLEHLGLADQRIIHRSVTELSVGQQQRVATARALLGSPEIIIADEPTSALDTDSREAFVKLLFQECEASGATLVFVSHDQTLEDFFHRSIFLHEINRAHGEFA